MNKFENSLENQQEQEPRIKILKGSEAPDYIKQNPFYNEYHWGQADDINFKRVYLPESDQGIFWPITAHEIGHLVKRDKIAVDGNDFQAVRDEELRAWQEGWKYLEAYVAEYYKDKPKLIEKVRRIKEMIEEEMMAITDLTEEFYKTRTNNIQQSRFDFIKTDSGKVIKGRIDGLKDFVRQATVELEAEELNEKVDWSRVTGAVKKALLDIENDNRKFEERKS